MRPDVSVVIPAHNEATRLAATIDSIAAMRTTRARVEIVIADDASDDDTADQLRAAWPRLSKHRSIDVRVSRLNERVGVPRARNHAVRESSADIVFITDAHVRMPQGWDATVRDHVGADRVLAGPVSQANSDFVGFGCRLVVPFMGTYWNKGPVAQLREVQVAACPATVLTRELFDRIGGYDEGMVMYGAAEPEFSVRAWLTGAEVVLVPSMRVEHRFKPQQERVGFVREMRRHMVHNSMRFGMLYLDNTAVLQMLRYHALKFPNLFQTALREIETSDVWQRRSELASRLRRDFGWFIDHFDLTDQHGAQLLRDSS